MGRAYDTEMKPTLTHMALHVRDLESCIRFYQEYAGLHLVHERSHDGKPSVVWLAETPQDYDFIIVLLAGGPGRDQADQDYSHLGFACASREEVDLIAAKAEKDGCLIWPSRQEDYPTGYYCGVRDPDGNAVEFSFGQPLGPNS